MDDIVIFIFGCIVAVATIGVTVLLASAES
jgi:hypothetical protein